MKEDRVPARLLSVFYYIKIPVGRPNNSVRRSFVSCIKKIIPFVDDQSSSNTWGYITHDEIIWS